MTVNEIKERIAELKAELVKAEANESDNAIDLDDDENEKQHQEDLQRLRGLRLIDDDFMNACFDGYIEGTEMLLRIILNKQDIHVKKVTTQRRIKNLMGRDVCLDIDADDDFGNEYNIEVQRTDKGAERKRARYHSSLLDAHLLQPGDDFGDLPETIVIFITEDDVIGGDLPIYTIERQITNSGEAFNDGEHIIYVNGADRNASTELGKLMHDFFCTDSDDMHYKELADKVRYFKEDEKGVVIMCKVLEDMREDARWKQVVASVLRWIAKGLSYEDIAEGEGITLEQVQEIAGMKRA